MRLYTRRQRRLRLNVHALDTEVEDLKSVFYHQENLFNILYTFKRNANDKVSLTKQLGSFNGLN